jgi:dTDP-4-amino-4,6-dideoxygalactose transaminase
MNWKIPLFKIYWDSDDIRSIERVIRRGLHWASGPEITELEKKIVNYVGVKYGVAFNSGTSALHALLLASGITTGEVIVPSFTFISSANAVVLAGAKPIFSEIETKTYGLDPEDVKRRITKKTKAIMAVHYGGCPCQNIRALHEIAEDNNLLLIEDAAESLGAKIMQEKVGTFGQAAMFSFCQNKIITGGEGGIIVTNDNAIEKKLKLIRSHGRLEVTDDYFSTTKEHDYIQLGYNYRMSSITASLVISQLKKIDNIINLRREKAQWYSKKLKTIDMLKTPITPEQFYHIYQMYTVQLNNKEQRDGLQDFLAKSGIMTKVYFDPVHLKSYYMNVFGYKIGDLPISENIGQRVLSLPIYPNIMTEDIDFIVAHIKKYFGVVS